MLALLTLAFADPLDISLQGVCDGSAAVRVPNANLLVAYDEDRSLHLYSVFGGPELASRDLSPQLVLSDRTELDLEAAAANAQTIWWMASHGNNKRGHPRKNRQVLFATNVPQSSDLSDLRVTQKNIDLLPLLRRAIPGVLTTEVLGRPPKKGGVNLEGLALHANGLVVGMRSPLTDPSGMTGRARIVVLNQKGSALNIAAIREVDLGNRGVRSISWTGTEYLIVAGPVGRKGSFELFQWDGKSSKATAVRAPLAGLNPEALVAIGGGRWVVLSDDGAVERSDWKGGDDAMSECKDIRADNPQGPHHPSVYARGRIFDLKPL